MTSCEIINIADPGKSQNARKIHCAMSIWLIGTRLFHDLTLLSSRGRASSTVLCAPRAIGKGWQADQMHMPDQQKKKKKH